MVWTLVPCKPLKNGGNRRPELIPCGSKPSRVVGIGSLDSANACAVPKRSFDLYRAFVLVFICAVVAKKENFIDCRFY
jgi:hypothetical protein